MKSIKPLTKKELKTLEKDINLVNLCKAFPDAITMFNSSRSDRNAISEWGYICGDIIRDTSSNDYISTIFSPSPNNEQQPLYFRYIIQTLLEKGYRIAESDTGEPGYIEYTIMWGNIVKGQKRLSTVPELINFLKTNGSEYLDFTLTDGYQVVLTRASTNNLVAIDIAGDVYSTAKCFAELAVGRCYDIDSVIKRLGQYKGGYDEMD